MKLKYYLRGLGIGIIVTAILMSVSHKKDVEAQGMTRIQEAYKIDLAEKDETKEELDNSRDTFSNEGNSSYYMEESSVETGTITSDVIDGTYISETDGAEDTNKSDESVSVESTELDMESSNDENSESSTELPAAVQELLDQNDYFEMEIVRGDDSATVARKLKNAGIISSASEFDAFLMQHGYDKKITTGKKYIPWGASWLEIANTLSKN